MPVSGLNFRDIGGLPTHGGRTREGVLFLIPLRRYFASEMHGQLPFPEATAITTPLSLRDSTKETTPGKLGVPRPMSSSRAADFCSISLASEPAESSRPASSKAWTNASRSSKPTKWSR